MLSSPRRPSSTILILSSAEKCRRVCRRMSLIASSAEPVGIICFCLIIAPWRDDGPETLLCRDYPICLMSADGEHSLGDHPLHVAVDYNQPEVVALLLARGAKVDAREVSG